MWTDPYNRVESITIDPDTCGNLRCDKVESQVGGKKDGHFNAWSWNFWGAIWEKTNFCSYHTPGQTPVDQKCTRRKHIKSLYDLGMGKTSVTDLKSTSSKIKYKFKCIVAFFKKKTSTWRKNPS